MSGDGASGASGPFSRDHLGLHVVVGLDDQEQEERHGDEADDGVDHEADRDAGVADVEADRR